MKAQVIGSLLLTCLSGCSLVLPRPHESRDEARWEKAEAQCGARLASAGASAVADRSVGGAAVPLIVEVQGTAARSDVIEYGMTVAFRRMPDSGGASAADGGASPPMLLKGVGPAYTGHIEVLNRSAIRLIPRLSGVGPARSPGTQEIELLIIKADAPDPNRPSLNNS